MQAWRVLHMRALHMRAPHRHEPIRAQEIQNHDVPVLLPAQRMLPASVPQARPPHAHCARWKRDLHHILVVAWGRHHLQVALTCHGVLE